jgi:hypothetical protein
MLKRMANRRTLIALEFLSRDGFRLVLDVDGWRLLNPRQLGQRQLEQARALLDEAERCLPPTAEDAEPPTMASIGDHVAFTLGLRITHHRFRRS